MLEVGQGNVESSTIGLRLSSFRCLSGQIACICLSVHVNHFELSLQWNIYRYVVASAHLESASVEDRPVDLSNEARFNAKPGAILYGTLSFY